MRAAARYGRSGGPRSQGGIPGPLQDHYAGATAGLSAAAAVPLLLAMPDYDDAAAVTGSIVFLMLLVAAAVAYLLAQRHRH